MLALFFGDPRYPFSEFEIPALPHRRAMASAHLRAGGQCGLPGVWGEQKQPLSLVKMINTTGDLTLITDGERRYGQVLFDLCSEVIRTGKRGRPPRPGPKAFRFELKTRAHAPLSAAASGRNTRPLAGSIRIPLRRLRTPRSIKRLSARDALHVAIMERHSVPRIMSFDSGFDGLPNIKRLS